MKLKHNIQIVLVALVVAWLFDQLFWQKVPGLSIALFVLFYLAGLIFISNREGVKPAKKSLWLFLPTILFSVLFFFRLEPFTSFINFILVSISLVLLTLTWTGGSWANYGVSDFVIRIAKLVGLGAFSPLQVYLLERDQQKSAGGEEPVESSNNRKLFKNWGGSVLLGLFMALPIIVILATLLSTADPVFKDQLTELLKAFSFEKAQEYFIRCLLILVVGYVILGGFLFSLLHSRDQKQAGQDKPLLPPFLNWISSGTVLLCINILFLTFVIIQFRYFFGGETNISYAGFTYADYAKRGFGELIFVAFISMVIFLGLGLTTKRPSGWKRHFYSCMGIGLVLLVGVMLVSAFQRLSLYEAAYGFTRLRSYTTVFLIWQGILLALIVVIELLNRLRSFVIVSLMVLFGFGITLTFMNIDGFISRQNIANAVAGHKLDQPYLVSLSDDVTPDLFDFYHNPSLSPDIHNQIGAVLMCRSTINTNNSQPDSWASFNFSRYYSQVLYTQFAPEFGAYTSYRESGFWHVKIYNQETVCFRRYDD